MLKGVAMRGLLGSHEFILSPLHSSSKGLYHITGDIPGVEMSREYLNDKRYERSRDLDYKTSNTLKEKVTLGAKSLFSHC